MIQLNDLTREPEELIQAQLRAAEAVVRSGWWILGQYVQRFEESWAKLTETAGAVGVGNGLDAIEIGLRALNLGPGDEVITTSLTAFATTLAIQRCGATPVFADIDWTTACICPKSIERCITPSTRAVLVVHLYGRSCDLLQIGNICKQNGLILVEDCAQAHGAHFQGHPVGSFGAFGAWSFYPTKNLGAIGDAGAITSSNQQLLDDSRMLRNYGQSDRYHHDLPGLNSRLDEMQAALLLERLKYLHSWTKKRRHIAHRYWQEIDNPCLDLLSPPSDPMSHVHHLFVLRAHDRVDIQRQLSESGIRTLIHYPVPCHLQHSTSTHGIDPQGLNVTVAHASRCLSLPIHPYLTSQEVDHVIHSCNLLQ